MLDKLRRKDLLSDERIKMIFQYSVHPARKARKDTLWPLQVFTQLQPEALRAVFHDV